MSAQRGLLSTLAAVAGVMLLLIGVVMYSANPDGAIKCITGGSGILALRFILSGRRRS